ncbi:MAG: hypothetical protein JWM92_631 [Candidatus Nomurabacteria bacterium]|jgi:hypothetical protein|nr:hypothetical protein [Candidatus Nomurabacteria bacterium]
MTTAKQYSIPVVPGYFSPQSSLMSFMVLHDAPLSKQSELQLYFNDLYQVFMHRVAKFAIADHTPSADEDKLASMFLELVKTKRALREE